MSIREELDLVQNMDTSSCIPNIKGILWKNLFPLQEKHPHILARAREQGYHNYIIVNQLSMRVPGRAPLSPGPLNNNYLHEARACTESVK